MPKCDRGPKARAFIEYHKDCPRPAVASKYLSSTWREFEPYTALVVCISLSLGVPYMVSISLGFPYIVMLQTFKPKRHCSGCGVAMDCYGRSIVPGAAIVTSQCYGRYCSTEYMWTWAGHLSTPWKREFTEITGCQTIDNLLDFNAICCIFLLNNSIYPVRGANLTLIQPTRSVYPYHLVFLI